MYRYMDEFVAKCWKAKSEAEEASGTKQNMPTYIYTYIMEKVSGVLMSAHMCIHMCTHVCINVHTHV